MFKRGKLYKVKFISIKATGEKKIRVLFYANISEKTRVSQIWV